jgi:hypothetical protein
VKLTLTTSKLQTRKERFNNEMAKTKLMKVIPATINQANNYYVVIGHKVLWIMCQGYQRCLTSIDFNAFVGPNC